MAQGVHADILLKADYNPNNWPIACIIETFLDKHGIARAIKLRLGGAVGAKQHELARSITKIVLLVESNSLTESDDNTGKLPGNFGGTRRNDDVTGLLK